MSSDDGLGRQWKNARKVRQIENPRIADIKKCYQKKEELTEYQDKYSDSYNDFCYYDIYEDSYQDYGDHFCYFE